MIQLTANPMYTMALLACAAAAAAFLLVSAINGNEQIRTRWARIATAIAAVFMLMWCGVTFLLLVESRWIPARFIDAALRAKTAIGGIGAGMIVVLLLSRSWRSTKKKDEPRT